MKAITRLAAAALAIAVATPANAQVVDFEGETTGVKADGYTVGGITFTTALGTGLEVGNYGSQSDGLGMLVRNDTNGNYLLGAIAGGTNFLSFDFGNDDPFFSTVGDLATLKVFSGATLLSTITVAMNRDDIMNQSIGYSGALIDNFLFAYTDNAGNPFTGGAGTNVGLIEIVDNFRLSPEVPEPATWMMLLLGFGAIGFGMRSRKAQQRLNVSYA
jgi:hypothetical protein